ncbi:MAG TPA: hypothetical protein VGI64_17870 [Streptosporangiaceae bacterium]|jgi:cytochrome bd-type quinol oxidase subunit 2
MRRWPLFLIASPAAVAVWSGWVGLGGLCGFGPVRLLPGISGFTINTAITLPIGVEAYGAYALGAWLSAPADSPARTFARRSAIGALLLGMLGQVAYHVLAASHAHRAPWPVVVLVSCLPVVTLGFGAALTHLLRAVSEPAKVRAADLASAVPGPGAPHPPALTNGHSAPEGGKEAAALFAGELSRGELPSVRAVRREMHLGQPRAQEVRAYLETLTRTQ